MNPALIAAILFAALALGWAVFERLRSGRVERRAYAAEARLEAAQANQAMLQIQAEQSAGAVAEAVLKRNEEAIHNREMLVQQRLEAQLKPVAETLAKFEAQVQAIEKSRAEDSGGLKAQIAALMQASADTQVEARKLSTALRRGAGVQGRWGEQALKNVLETAGLNAHFDFTEQVSLDTEEGRRRPDVTVRMPGGAVFVIDAKCSLTAWMEAQDAVDDVAREAALVRHAQSVRGHMQGLAGKAYWDQFVTNRSPDFVAMFIAGDGFLAAALERMPDLLTEGMGRRVLIVTPTTLFALCKAVAYGWRVEEQAKNADEVAELGRDLYKRLSVMGGHVAGMGKALESAVGRYNQFVGSLETQVMTQARRFEDLKVDHEGRELPQLEPVEVAARTLNKLAPPEPEG
ncbi:DNA recombination protein RmuC [Caulobacter ginsengisoli]|uniref:DNA recombination protein RmuC homolog n=1 Tax=Caulobacter ginsengisoli TaxID=400775 RepID=A0ABU0IWL7_9CAUL|nr:DNA recombination protein RmuC [Caulobacter ginsengisoli]MDQ0466413.1 DNA recombination protein RmuC [Caulobacter ginsengisoli]